MLFWGVGGGLAFGCYAFVIFDAFEKSLPRGRIFFLCAAQFLFVAVEHAEHIFFGLVVDTLLVGGKGLRGLAGGGVSEGGGFVGKQHVYGVLGGFVAKEGLRSLQQLGVIFPPAG